MFEDFFHLPFFNEKHRDLRSRFEAWIEKKIPPLLEQEEEKTAYQLAPVLVKELGSAGWLSFLAPEEEEADVPDVRTLCLFRQHLAGAWSLADFSLALQGLGSGPLLIAGTVDQKKTYLPDIRAGECITAFALSEKEAGSDPSAIKTRARKEGKEYVLEGSKTWISNAGIADLYVVFARTENNGANDPMTAFLVEADREGLEVSEQIETISPHPLGSLAFDSCRIPESNRLGAEGDGLKIALKTLDLYRSTVGAAATGFAERALEETIEHTKKRYVFDSPLAQKQIPRERIATAASQLEGAALLVYRAAWKKDCYSERVTKEAAMAKSRATEMAQDVIDMAVQMHGGKGVTRGEIVERLYRDIRPLRIYEGATEIQNMIIARQILDD